MILQDMRIWLFVETASYTSMPKSEVNVPEISFMNSRHPLVGPFGMDMSSTGTIMCEVGPVAEQGVSFLSMLGIGDGNTQQLTLAPLSASAGQLLNGNLMQYLQYTTENSHQMATPYVVTSFSDVNGIKSNEEITVDGTVAAEECIMDTKTVEDTDQIN